MRRSADSLTTPSRMEGQTPQVKTQETLAVWSWLVPSQAGVIGFSTEGETDQGIKTS